jgi:hypothetical protein
MLRLGKRSQYSSEKASFVRFVQGSCAAISAHPLGVGRFRDGRICLVRNEVLHIAENALRETLVSRCRFQQEPDDLRLVHHVQYGKRVVQELSRALLIVALAAFCKQCHSSTTLLLYFLIPHGRPPSAGDDTG